jgi:membrane-associated protease RseP (regulator of RpoE activity)
MLGITTDEFNSAIAQKLGIPVSQGLRIAGVVEGMGAQKAGLQSDDVIVKLDEYEITGGSVFSIFIQKHKAGDVLKVTYYRGSEKRITEMTLSSRPIPPIPVSCSELLKQVQPVYQHYEDELEDVLKNSTDEECSKKPTPREWSAKEVIAHLIHSELGWQNVMSEIMGGYEGSYDDFGGNNQAHIDGTVATFSTKDELFRELKDHDAETLNMVSHIPSEFLTHKGKYWKLVFQINQNAFHLQSHLDQIRSAIHAARNS